MKEFNPLVSIIIPVYNGENYVKEAIDSALAQTYKNIEILVINDGSKDKTEKICKSYNKKIRYIKKENGGVASALNLGIKEANGEYISWLSHDDLYEPNKILCELEHIKKSNDKMTIVSCNYDFINEKGKKLYKNEVSPELLDQKNGLEHVFNYTINGCALLINKKYFEKYGYFDEKLYTTQDFDMWFRIFRENELLFINEYLVHSRVHNKQGSKALINYHVKECDELWINFINSVTKKEIEETYGTEYAFYKNLLTALKKHVIYPNVFEYIEVKITEIVKKDKVLLKDYLLKNYNYQNKDIINFIIDKKSKPRILFGGFGPWQDRGGLNRVVANIANNLCDDFEVILMTHGDIKAGYDISNKVHILNINYWMLKGQLEYKFYYLLKLLDVDIFINPCNCVKPLIELLKFINDRGIKSIAWNHEYYFLPYYNQEFDCVVPIRNDVFSQLPLVIWLTSASKIIYDQFANNSVVMNNALTVNNNFVSSDFSDKSIISIGRFEDIRKEAETLILLAKELKTRNIKIPIKCYGTYDLNLIGKKTHKKLKDLLTEYDLTNENIEFKGFVKNIEEVLQHAMLNIVASYHEGFGLTIIESATYGIPTIAFNDSGFEDMITDGSNGYLLPRNDFDSLTKVINNIFTNKKLFNNLSKNAQENAKNFKMENIISRWKQVLTMVLRNETNELSENFKISEKINKQTILENGIKEYETVIKNKISGNTNPIVIPAPVDDEEKISFLRTAYRKLPLNFRKKMKRKIMTSENKILTKVKKKL